MSRFAFVLSVSLLLLGLGRPLAAQTGYNFTTLAGWPGVSGSADGTVGIARFATPTGMAIDSAGNFYVTDTASNTIRKVTSTGTVVSTVVGIKGVLGSQDGPVAQAQFCRPQGLAVDQAGNIYVADTGNSTVRKITPGGTVSTLAGAPLVTGSGDGVGASANFKSPGGIAVDISGNVYVADTGNNTVRMITPAGLVTTVAGTAGQTGSGDGLGAAARFSAPNGVAVDRAGNLYVSDSGNGSIRLITSSGAVTTFATGIGALEALTIDSAGNVDVVITGASFDPFQGYGQSICQISPTGVVSTLAALTPTIQSTDETIRYINYFPTPVSGVVADGSDNIYATDPGSGMIRKIIPGTGTVNLFAGTDEATGQTGFRIAEGGTSLDGSVGTARFNSPQGLGFDAAGNLYMVDSASDTIRKMTPTGIVSTFAGTPGRAGSIDGPGSNALFNGPTGIALDTAGNLYVADTGNKTIRKVTPTGLVSTLVTIGAQFTGITVDGAGNVYIADTTTSSILKISPAGWISTLAGIANNRGNLDGPGSSALFNSPTVIAADRAGNIYVYDSGNYAVRKITPSGVVITLAGGSTNRASPAGGVPINPLDGTGSGAQFGSASAGSSVLAMAADNVGNLYVADGNEVRQITPSGVVTTIGGFEGADRIAFGLGGIGGVHTGNTDGQGKYAVFNVPAGIAVDSAGNLYVADTGNDSIRFGTFNDTQVVTAPPSSQTVASGHTVVFNALAAGTAGSNYSWSFKGGPITGATDSILVIPSAAAANAGVYTCYVENTNPTGISINISFTLNVTTAANSGYLVNLSSRAYAGTGTNTLIGGFAILGTGSKEVLIRGVGPGLNYAFSPFPGFVPNPTLTLMNSVPAQIDQNASWGGTSTLMTAFSALGAFPLSPSSEDTALLDSLPTPGAVNYTAQVSSGTGGDGTGLMEIYDADSGAPAIRLVNISARAFVGTGQNILIGGFVIGGTTAETVLIRAVGPGLTDTFGLSGTLAQPVLTLFSGGTALYSNTGWGGDPLISNAFTTVGAFPLNPAHTDSALLVTLPPGQYTAQVSGINSGTGVALMEIYEVY